MGSDKRNRVIALFAVAVVGGLAVYWLIWSRTAEPMHNGRPLSYWLQGYSSGSSPIAGVNTAAANAALDEAGAGATPVLLRMLRARDSSLGKSLIALSRKQHFVNIPYHSSLQQNLEAVSGFLHSSKASEGVTVAEWMEVYERRPSMVVEHFILGVLCDLGPAAKDAVPMLLQVAGNTNANPLMRVDAFEALGKIHASSQSTVPILLAATHDASPLVRDAAIENLGPFGGDAKLAVSTLLDFLKGSNSTLQAVALRALKQIDADAAAKVLQVVKPVAN